MKSLEDISWKVTEKEYRACPDYSYSTLARFHREGFNGLSHLYDPIESPSLVFGSMVDTLITEGEKALSEQYIAFTFPSISDTLVNITKALFEEFGDTYNHLEDIPEESISKVGVEQNYYVNKRYDKSRAKMILKNCEYYYSLLRKSKGKTVVTNVLYSEAQACGKVLKESPNTKFYFQENNPFDKTIERFYQLKFKGDYNGIKVRCMADSIVVNHKDKTIQPIDLKTSFNPEWDFAHSFVHWCYYIQAQLYWYIINQNIKKDPVYKDYTLLDYKFIVISKGTLTPLVWNYKDTQAEIDCVYGNTICKNWREILKDLNYYITVEPRLPINIKPVNEITDHLE